MQPVNSEAARLETERRTLRESASSVAVRLSALERSSTRFGMARVLTFVFILIGAVLAQFAGDRTVGPWVVLFGIVTFVAAVVLHQPILAALERSRRLAAIIAAKLASFDRPEPGYAAPQKSQKRLPISEETGGTFVLPDHVLDDLSILRADGNDLATWLDGSGSALGSTRIRQWLKHPLIDCPAVRARQEAVRRLLDDRARRHAIEEAISEIKDEPLLTMLDDIEIGVDRPMPSLLAAIAGIVAATSIVFGLAAESGVLTGLGGVVALLGNLFWRSHIVASVEERKRALRARSALVVFAKLRASLAAIERPPLLDDIFRRLDGLVGDGDLDRHLSRLSRLRIYQLGLVYVALNALTFYDVATVGPIAEWRKRRRKEIRAAFEAAADLDALVGLAARMEVKADLVFASIVDDKEPRLFAKDLAHPLVDYAAVVPNDLDLGRPVRMLVVTGSNMAGKSTYLRSAGIFVVASQAGAPVRARSAVLTPLKILTDINVRDALENGRSFFAVEAERLKEIIDLAVADRRSFFLLDEMFRGTNTLEKVAAGLETARYLVRTGALAILATHDHEFVRLEDESQGGSIVNVHFTEQVVGPTMSFDFKKRSGPALGGNALRVLESKGFPKEVVERARRAVEGRG